MNLREEFDDFITRAERKIQALDGAAGLASDKLEVSRLKGKKEGASLILADFLEEFALVESRLKEKAEVFTSEPITKQLDQVFDNAPDYDINKDLDNYVIDLNNPEVRKTVKSAIMVFLGGIFSGRKF
jgi:hypothetical protein